jgi:hypothetical protein
VFGYWPLPAGWCSAAYEGLAASSERCAISLADPFRTFRNAAISSR